MCSLLFYIKQELARISAIKFQVSQVYSVYSYVFYGQKIANALSPCPTTIKCYKDCSVL